METLNASYMFDVTRHSYTLQVQLNLAQNHNATPLLLRQAQYEPQTYATVSRSARAQ
jgi:hypothetical protein